MKLEDFRENAHQVVDWICDYYDQIEKFPVKSQVKPGEIYSQLPDSPPPSPESFELIFKDFERIIVPGMTHWQHPSFFAYFNGNTSFPSILGEMLTSALAAQCMIWDTSPSAAELEELVCNWLLQMLALPADWHGSIQDTASTATLTATICARENATNFSINDKGFSNHKFTVYSSAQAHSSIEKNVKIAGIGKENLRKIETDEQFAMRPELLETAIKKDIENGLTPLMIIAASGTTSSVAFDPIEPITALAKRYKLWLHVDAAYAGSAAICPEYRWFHKGVEHADSYVFNPHKWMFVNFDCSILYVKNKASLVRSFEILPEYLKTGVDDKVNNYRDWGIQLGRRFRALKLWMVIRSFGVEGLQQKYREHMRLASLLKENIEKHDQFELMAPVYLNLVCFRYNPGNLSEEKLDSINAQILKTINDDGRAYITHTKLNGKYTIRCVVGQTNVEERHVTSFWNQILEAAQNLS